MTDELDALRGRVARIDDQVASLIAKRLEAVREIGRLKRERRITVRDERVEARVVRRFTEASRGLALSPDFPRELARLLIEESVRIQDGSPPVLVAEGQRVLVVGGRGRMGSWLARYFRGQGERVTVHDIAGPLDGFPFASTLEEAVGEADVVALATPIGVAAAVLERIVAAKPGGLVFDVCSIKAPIVAALRRAAEAGLEIASVHPMFGPDAGSLAGRSVLFCDLGNRAALARTMDLFSGTGANLVEIPVDRHDALIARVLGLSHATNIAFFTALAGGPFTAAELRGAASTTFRRQAETARQVANENPDLYFEIQALNPHTAVALRELERALADLQAAALHGDAAAFRALMESGRRFFGGD